LVFFSPENHLNGQANAKESNKERSHMQILPAKFAGKVIFAGKICGQNLSESYQIRVGLSNSRGVCRQNLHV
jgi:hypothetical protein